MITIPFIYSNSLGISLSITDTNSPIRAISIDGLSPTSSISVSPNYDSDGGVIVSERLGTRSINILLAFCNSYEKCKKLLFDTFITKDTGKLIYINDNNETFHISCYVEKISLPVSERAITAQITLICPDPFWTVGTSSNSIENGSKISILGINNKLQFPWFINKDGFEFATISNNRIAKITNNGITDSGCIFELFARSQVVNPRLENNKTFDFIELDFTMLASDKIIINTIKGQKSITLIRNNNESNIINSKVWGSKFLQLSPGFNEIVCNASDGIDSLSVTITFAEKYGGL